MPKISSYPTTTPQSGDYLVIARSGSNYKVDISTLVDGWIPVTATWTRTGNHTFTVTGDVTASYRKGTKVRYKDGGSYEYGVIATSAYVAPNTTVTLITNSDYAMAAATITDTYISYIENPAGFPFWFNYAPTFTGFSADPASGIYRWHVTGRRIRVAIRQPNNGTSNSTGFTISAPVAAITIANMIWDAPCSFVNNSSASATSGNIYMVSAATSFGLITNWSSGAWTASNGKRCATASIEYEF